MSDFYQGGWVDFEDRTPEQNERHEDLVAQMAPFHMAAFADADTPAKIILTDYWKHERVRAALGFDFTRFWQLTGSCVGVAEGDVAATTNWVEVVENGEMERIILPFWPLTYGMSRLMAGMRGRGEGSTGSGMAAAAVKYGKLDARLPGLPEFRPMGDKGVCYTKEVELQWSDGAAIDPKWLEESATKVYKTVSRIKNSEEGRAAIKSRYAMTLAFGAYIGHPRIQGTGENAALVGTFDTRGGHQTSIQGVWDHPTLGLLFRNQNQWPPEAYPRDPSGGMPCSCWMTAKDFDLACQRGEVYVYSALDGYPVRSGWSLSRE